MPRWRRAHVPRSPAAELDNETIEKRSASMLLGYAAQSAQQSVLMPI